MSLNKITLSPHTVAGFYPDLLVETPNTSVTTSMPETAAVKFLGNNKKNILVAVQHPDMPYLPDGELSFLTNILAACKLSIADIAIVNTAGNSQVIHSAIDSLLPEQIILFGMEPADLELPFNIPPFQLQKFGAHIWLCGPALSAIEADKNLKMKLWNNLKAMFGL